MASTSLSPVMAIENLEITTKPNWLELPKDIAINILQRLPTLEIVTSACVVCPLWWNICKDPIMWSTIDMLTGITIDAITELTQRVSYFGYLSKLEKICRYAVDRSRGHLKNLYILKFATDDLLSTIAKRESNLRCIRLKECYEISNEAFCEVVKKQPFLEELDIYHCYDLGRSFFEYIGQCCPHMKSLKFFPCEKGDDKCDNVAFAIGKTMTELRHLTIFHNELSNDGLLAIIDGCPLLESLDLRGCFHLELDEVLLKRCKRQIRELTLPNDSAIPRFSFVDHISYVSLKLKIR